MLKLGLGRAQFFWLVALLSATLAVAEIVKPRMLHEFSAEELHHASLKLKAMPHGWSCGMEHTLKHADKLKFHVPAHLQSRSVPPCAGLGGYFPPTICDDPDVRDATELTPVTVSK